MAENNSIQTLLPELLRLFNNSLESFEKVNQAITSSRDSVTVNIQNNDGTNSRITIPSFGYLKNSVDRLNTNINTITNFNDANSSIRLPDGTFRKLVLAQLPTEAADLTSLNSINQFDIKPNWFFEELINPLLYRDCKNQKFPCLSKSEPYKRTPISAFGKNGGYSNELFD